MYKPTSRRLSLVVVASSSLLSGCMSGPNYQPPASWSAASATGPFVSKAPEVTPAAPLPADWWRLYDDPALASIVETALAANADLRAANANLQRAHAVLSEARAGRFPTTTTSGGVTWGRGQTSQGGAYNSSSNREQFVEQGGMSMAWEVDLFGRVSRTIEAARGSAEAEAAARDAVRVAVVAGTTRSYSEACALSQSINVARSSLALAQDSYRLVADQERAGSASSFDLERAGTAVASAQAAIPPLEGQRRAALFELAALMGRAPSEVPAAATACTRAPQPHRPIPIGDGAALLRRRPDVRQAERTVASDTARIGVAMAELYPKISLGGAFDYTHSGSGQFGPAISFSFGPLITWSFPNFAVAQARISEARSTTDADLANFDGVVLTALKETEQALTAYAADMDERSALEEARNRSARAFGLADRLYRAGSTSYLDQISAQTTLTDAEAKLAASELKLAIDRVALFKALGGGWEAQNPAEDKEANASVAHGKGADM
ncbi:TolC family protein [Nitrospirillum sp. BR 11163]|uniref:TolC family protein n=1 Tax=Nitrospirillum sp. BR 11163 TaxID=3104323 RepID=UPI002AFFD14B|nr:TolC family protein [Nitrospirillum sp. BR 11163]MEA1672878.1 TolC family protein [Nitrospirillum sp. BR 11163]